MIKIYAITVCPYCSAAKQLLTERGLEYEEINIEHKGISREKLIELTGGRTVPQIIINDKPIGGYDNLLVLDQKGELK
ncbi:MAG: glutaredoxin 3 [Candidatus Neomarinimicrobiota bacterium]